MNTLTIIAWLPLLAVVHLAPVPAQRPARCAENARRFVQAFYDWYLPLTSRSAPDPPWEAAVKRRGEDLSPELAGALRADLAAQAETHGAIAGLDFDPFLDTQDPCERYSAAAASLRRGRYLVPVYAVCSGERSTRPAAVVLLRFRHGRWRIMDLDYPPIHENLLSILGRLRRNRKRRSR